MKKILILILIPIVFLMSGCSKKHHHTSCHSFLVEESLFDILINRSMITYPDGGKLGEYYKNRKQLFSAVDRQLKKRGYSFKAKDINFFTIDKNNCEVFFPKSIYLVGWWNTKTRSIRYAYKVRRNQDNKKYVFVTLYNLK